MMPVIDSKYCELPARQASLPIVAIVGRPNVGKSTLFNRLVGERKAIVDDMPGVTRDRNYAEADVGRADDICSSIPAAWIRTARRELEESVQAQSRSAVAEADVIVFLFDGKGGLNPLGSRSRRSVAPSRQAGVFCGQQARLSAARR